MILIGFISFQRQKYGIFEIFFNCVSFLFLYAVLYFTKQAIEKEMNTDQNYQTDFQV